MGHKIPGPIVAPLIEENVKIVPVDKAMLGKWYN